MALLINIKPLMRCFVVLHILGCVCLSQPGPDELPSGGDTSQANEIRWEEAAAQVDSFPFSAAFVDSVRKTHEVRLPERPLRVMTDKAFCAPETLVLTVGWGPFNAGYVVLTTNYDSVGNTIRVGGKALSNNFVGAFYKMRDYVISTIDARGLYPLFFEQHLREGKRYRANEYLLFDHVKGIIHIQSKKKFKTEKVQPFLHDYLSVLHLIRSQRALAPGDTFSEKIFIHSKAHSIFFSVKASKPREVDGRHIPCVLLTPRLAGEGRAFNKRDKLEIWISDDRRHMPVAIRSKIKFGAINAKLKWYTANDCSAVPLTE